MSRKCRYLFYEDYSRSDFIDTEGIWAPWYLLFNWYCGTFLVRLIGRSLVLTVHILLVGLSRLYGAAHLDIRSTN